MKSSDSLGWYSLTALLRSTAAAGGVGLGSRISVAMPVPISARSRGGSAAAVGGSWTIGPPSSARMSSIA